MKQAERIYLISDAAKQVQVESHVLRYWEDELKLPIKRNELGHRFYTEEDIARFRQIRDLKEQGLQLKAIRNIMAGGGLGSAVGAMGTAGAIGTAGAMGMTGNAADAMSPAGSIGYREKEESVKRHVVMVNKGEFMPINEESREAKSIRLQQLLQNMIVEAVRSNNREVCDEIKESLLKELDYQFRLQEEREDEREGVRLTRQEEHYRQIDELIRLRNKRKKFKSKDDIEERIMPELSEKERKAEKPKSGFLRKKRSIN